MRIHTEYARAKVNLNLKVLGKRDDGFHALETRMAPISLADQLHFSRADAYELSCETAGVPVDESNLVSMAVRIFQRETGKSCAYHIELEKHVPHAAGLGGGSGDAAAALRALNELEQANVPVETLAEWSAEIGSDVPFFVYDSVCDCSGRGEIVEPCDWPHQLDAVLLKPQFAVSTPKAFQAWLGSEEIQGVDYAPQAHQSGVFFNDLERPVFQKHRFLAEMKMWILGQAEVDVALMSGSGSTMIAILSDRSNAESFIERAKKELDPSLWTSIVKIG